MKYVTAMFVIGTKSDIYSEPHVVYVTMGVDKYNSILGATGKCAIRDENTGMGAWVNVDLCSAVHCGPQRDTP